MTSKFECPSYTCGDGRRDARSALVSKNPQMFKVDNNGVKNRILAVPFGEGFPKFVGMIVSYPEGMIYSLPPEGGNIYYYTDQSVFFE